MIDSALEVTHGEAVPPAGLVEADVCGVCWKLSRPADLETLWNQMGEGDLGDDERLPYWVELWPAAVLLARWLAKNGEGLRSSTCLDVGCGLGLSSLVAAAAGAHVLAFDYEPEALVYARRNIALNKALLNGGAPLFALMDWRRPALAAGSINVVVGADILYERRFFEPVATLLDYAVAPGGVVWLADPEREVSSSVWERLERLGWRVSTPFSDKVSQSGQNMTVHLRQLDRR
jgi:Predicted methyltransferase